MHCFLCCSIVPSGLSDVVNAPQADKDVAEKAEKDEKEMKPINTTYVFTRYSLKQ